jgi:hypothetical protein
VPGRRAILGLLVAAAGLAQNEAGLDPETLLLARIKVHMEEHLRRQPDYTCQLTIERSRRRAPARRYQHLDTLRLEVALVEGKELFSWPGEREFQDRDLRALVPTGTIGTGSFALHARSVFLSSWPRYHRVGEELFGGRLCHRYDYSVSLPGSRYYLKVGALQALVPYHGSFWVDAETLDLVRLIVRADVIPPELELESVTETIDYAITPIGRGQFLLPKTSETVLVDPAGNEHRNRTVFSDCRQYAGESFLSFSEPPAAEAPAPRPAPAEVELPEGAYLDLELQTTIDGENSRIGDPIVAVLRSPVKRGREVVMPKGALARGRLLHLERVSGRVTWYIVAIQFETLESHDRRATVRARLEEISAVLPYGGRPVVRAAFPGGILVRRPALEAVPGAGIFYVKGEMIRLGSGTWMVWRTAKPSDGKVQ